MRVVQSTAAFVVGMLALGAVRAEALDPRRTIADYLLTSWNQREGLPWGPIYALAQTPDGYLWLPTASGLLRFDGVRFAVWQPIYGESMPGAYATALHRARDGSLWVGFIDGRISHIRDGRIVNYTVEDGLVARRVRAFVDAADGDVWVWSDPFGVTRLRDGVWRQMRTDEGAEIEARCLMRDTRERVWVCAHGAAVWDREREQFDRRPVAIPQLDWLVEDAAGRIVGLASDGRMHIVEGTPTDRYAAVRLSGTRVIVNDRHGNMWAASTNGLYRFRNDGAAGPAVVERLGKSEGLSSDVVLSLCEDGEGNLWVGTSNGLNRIREAKLGSIARLERRASVLAVSLLATPDGSVWVGTAGGLTRFEIAGGRPVERETLLPTSTIGSLAHDPGQNRLFIGAFTGFSMLTPSPTPTLAHVSIPQLAQPLAITREATGRLWFADAARGVIRWHPDAASTVAEFGQSSAAFAALADRDGTVWVGYDDGHVLASSPTGTRIYSTRDGLSGAPVRTIYQDRSGAVWIGTDRGLSRYRSGQFTTFTRAHGLPADFVSDLIEDDAGMFWLGTGAGIARVAPAEFDQAIDPPGHRIELTLYDASDGLRGMPAHAGNPGVTRTRDGQLWFLTQNGIAIVDPSRPSEKRPPLPVHIEAIDADDVPMDRSKPLELPARTRDVTIDYTAPDLSAPDRVRFRYRLEGLEDEWRDVGGRRQAFYNNLPPGRYRFRVIASNGDGVWNEVGAAADFRVLPAFYQTRAFQGLVIGLLVLGGWAAHRLRLWQIARRLRAQFETRVAERARIAAELHDTLIQDLAAMNFQAEIIDDQLPLEPEAAKQTLDGLRTSMQRVVSEGRRGMSELRMGLTESHGLAEALSQAAQELRHPNGPSFHVVVQGHPRSLHPLVGDEVYRIAREAVGNAFRHSAARRIDVEVSFTHQDLRVRVHDDGRGISEEVLQAGRPGHFGLHGMRERARQIGATLRVWSRVDVGTEVAVIVPGHSAFQLPD